MHRSGGPYVADPGDDFGQYGFGRGRQPQDEVLDFNEPPEGQPGLWCQWIPTDDGSAIVWNGGEKFYHAPEWMAYLIDHFLREGAQASQSPAVDERLKRFTFNHVLEGQIFAQGEDPDDRWVLVVRASQVFVRYAQSVQYGEPQPI